MNKRLPKVELIPILRNCTKGNDIPITTDLFYMGSEKGKNHWVLMGKNISSNHCFIQRKHGCWLIQDTSAAGTIVNDVKLKPRMDYPLEDGDRIQFGRTKNCRFEFKLCPKKDDAEEFNDPTNQNMMEMEMDVVEPHNQAEDIDLDVEVDNLEQQKRARVMELNDQAKLKRFKLEEVRNKIARNLASVNREREKEQRVKDEFKPKLNAIEAALKATNDEKLVLKSRLMELSDPDLVVHFTDSIMTDERREKIRAAIMKHFMCPICIEVLIRPMILKCGHVYCEKCIIRWQDFLICINCSSRDLVPVGMISVLEKYLTNSVQIIKSPELTEITEPNSRFKSLDSKIQIDILDAFTCCMCGQLFMTPIVFTCNHVFCEYCARTFKLQGPDSHCYMSQCSVRWEVASYASFIDKFLEDVIIHLPPLIQMRRHYMLQYRQRFRNIPECQEMEQMIAKSMPRLSAPGSSSSSAVAEYGKGNVD